jgi:hypothetical protein
LSAQARTILSVFGEGLRRRADIAAEVGVETTNLKPVGIENPDSRRNTVASSRLCGLLLEPCGPTRRRL